jgi:hypothetical protein
MLLNACHQIINLQRLLRKGGRQVPDWIGGDFSLVFSLFNLNDQHPIQEKKFGAALLQTRVFAAPHKKEDRPYPQQQ